jgi:ABC-2 type transporter
VFLQLIVIASIHQPSTSTFGLFDKLLLLSAGRSCYFGRVKLVPDYFKSLGSPLPMMTNPAEHLLEQTNIDFARDREAALLRLEEMQRSWARSPEADALLAEINGCKSKMAEGYGGLSSENFSRSNRFIIPFTLLHRSFIKSYRDVVAYGIRIAMYTGKPFLINVPLSG